LTYGRVRLDNRRTMPAPTEPAVDLGPVPVVFGDGTADGAVATPRAEVTRLRDLSSAQKKSGVAAWLGWLFDGLDMHLYTFVAAPLVAILVGAAAADQPDVKEKAAWIQASFLVGWAVGGAFFGRLGDLVGRSRSLALTILTYALFTGLSFFVTEWWHLLICRFLAALGIGGEWAVGSSLLSETWPAKWRAWVAAVLQTGVNLGVILACVVYAVLADDRTFDVLHGLIPGLPRNFYLRGVFLVGILPAVMVFWIRRHVPEPEEWAAARAKSLLAVAPPSAARASPAAGPPSDVLEYAPPAPAPPRVSDLFRGDVRRITLLTIGVCSFALTGWWAFMFWSLQHVRGLPSLSTWRAADREQLISMMFLLIIGVSIAGNFVAAALARRLGYRNSIAVMCLLFSVALAGAYYKPRTHEELYLWLPMVGFCSGVFGLFTMYLPPLFPTLLRTTGAGFSYNIGRIVAAAGTVVFAFGLKVTDLRGALLSVALLFVPAAIIAVLMPDLRDVPPGEQRGFELKGR
jgi:MFS family permease